MKIRDNQSDLSNPSQPNLCLHQFDISTEQSKPHSILFLGKSVRDDQGCTFHASECNDRTKN